MIEEAARLHFDCIVADFRFARHPRLDLPVPRLRALESFVRVTAAELARR